MLDIVLVHSDGNDLDVIERSDVLATLAQCKQEGLVRSFGVSTKTVSGGIAAAQKTDSVMATYNPLFTDERIVLDYCAEHAKGVLIKKAFASGLSSDHAGALQFALAHRAVSSVIIGTINPLHLQANALAAQVATIGKQGIRNE